MPDPIPWAQLSPNERDALIAEHIFKRKIIKWKDGRVLLMAREGAVGHESIPPYSTSMDAAWLIVEKLHEKYDIRLYMEEGFSTKYCVNTWLKDSGRTLGGGHSNISMPDAVCLAALKACGVEVEA